MNERIIEIIKNNTESKSEISEDSLLSELEITSLDFVRIIVEIENNFDFEFDDDKLHFSEFSTVGSLVNYVNGRIGK